MAYRLLATGMGDLSQHWQLMLAALAVLSLAIGNVVAIVQTNLKRLLAYSTISHMGYLLLGLVNAGPEGYAAAMFYAISYALMSTAAFGVILALSRAGFECEEIDDFKGLNQRSPWMAFLMMLVMFSLAGVPPMFGFFAKLLVLQAAIHAGMMWLAIVGAVFAIIGLYYYLRVVKVMYFDKPVEGTEVRLQTDFTLRVALSLNALALLALGLCWGPAVGVVQAGFRGLTECVPSRVDDSRIIDEFKACKNSAISLIFSDSDAGWSSLAARRAHNPKVAGSNPAPATRSFLDKKASS